MASVLLVIVFTSEDFVICLCGIVILTELFVRYRKQLSVVSSLICLAEGLAILPEPHSTDTPLQ